MTESTAYQGFLAEGRTEGHIDHAHRFIVRLAQKRVGKPTAPLRAALGGINDLERLDRIGEGLLNAAGWQELLEAR